MQVKRIHTKIYETILELDKVDQFDKVPRARLEGRLETLREIVDGR